MSAELIQALEELEKERGIPKDVLIDAIESALRTAYKKNFGSNQNVEVQMDGDTGVFTVFCRKTAIEDVLDDKIEISREHAQDINADAQIGDEVEIEVTPGNFGRIAAQTAKQVVIQRLREAERNIIFEEYVNREGEIVAGTVQRTEQRVIIINLGQTEAIMVHQDQIPGETFAQGQ
ncbi:MAG: transcription termination/antitermination protein NusA, partial [Syntrophomonadaceae bacterium]|nr:transcription termination/antitermination protein NusA [Syntrophomonadaceae bacterium]